MQAPLRVGPFASFESAVVCKLVNVVSAQRWQQCSAGETSLHMRIAMTMMDKLARAKLCVIMQCENQVKRTSVTMGQAHPVWKEEVTFKSVQITSDLQVSLRALTAHSIVLCYQTMP